MVSVASSSAERGGCFYGQQTRQSSRGEGAGLEAPAAAAKEEQLTRHLRTNFIRTNGGARHRLSASPEPAGCGWLCGVNEALGYRIVGPPYEWRQLAGSVRDRGRWRKLGG